MIYGAMKFGFLRSKMKFLVFLIITKFLAISSSQPKYKFAPVVINCQLLLPVENYSETVLIDMDIRGHPEIKTCILQSSMPDQSVLLLNTNVDTTVNLTKDSIFTNNNPNVIIITKYLTSKMIESLHSKFPMRSNWSLLYIVITGDRKFKCKNDKMSTEDFSFLDNIMNALWQRFQIMRVGVIFPFACEQKMVIYNGKRPSTRILYDRSIKLIDASHFKHLSQAVKESGEMLADDYPIKASIFRRHPTSIKTCQNVHYYVNLNLDLTNGYCGMDGMVMHDILSHLKFNLSFPENKDCDHYGYAIPGNVSGVLGCIIRSELDISFNSRFMTMYSDEHIYYLHYINTDTLCALIKKPSIIPVWHGVFNLFSTLLWVIIGAVLFAIGCIMWTTAIINKTMAGPETMTFWGYLHKSVMTTMFGYSPMKRKKFIMLRSSCLVGSIFFMAIYQGHLNRVFTTVRRYPQIKTLQDLYSSGVKLYISPSLKVFMRQVQNPKDKLQAAFFDQAIEMPGSSLGITLQRNAAIVDRRIDSQMEITEHFLDSDDNPLVDIINECFSTYYLSYIARTGFPFYKDLQFITEKINEAGLPTKYYKWTREMLDIPNSKTTHDNEPRPFFEIKLTDERVAFEILFLGTILSAIVFAVEMWQGRRHHFKLYKRRH